MLTAGREDYRIPGIGDVPDVDLHFDEDSFAHVPIGGVGLGEASTMPIAAAVANAVRDATGVRLYEIPIRPDRLLAALAASALVVDRDVDAGDPRWQSAWMYLGLHKPTGSWFVAVERAYRAGEQG